MSKFNASRIYHIDILKFIAIFSVIFYHCFSTSVDVRSYDHLGAYFIKSLLSVCIPLFLTVNGGLLFQKNFCLEKHFMKMVRLVFLVFIWDLINVTAKMFVYGEQLSPAEYLHKLWYFEPGWSNQLWYLMALFVLYVFFPIFKCTYDYSKKNLRYFMFIVLIIIFGNSTLNMIARIGLIFFHKSVHLTDYDFFNQFNPLRGLYGYTFAYFLLGAFLFPFAKKIRQKMNPIYSIIGFFLSVLFLAIYGLMISVSSQEVWDTVSAGYSSVFVLTATIFIFSLSLHSSDNSQSKTRKIIQSVSENSLGIYLFQSLLTDIVNIPYRKSPISGNIVSDCILSIILLMICYLLTIFSKKIPYIKYLCML